MTEQLVGASLTPLPASAGRSVTEWLSGGSRVETADGAQWCLLHQSDGVIWGRLDGDRWVLASEHFPHDVPTLDAARIIECRLFGDDVELLLWQGGDGVIGRVMRDEQVDDPDETPIDECRPLVGEDLIHDPVNGFSPVRDRTGRRQVLPCAWHTRTGTSLGVHLVVRHYLSFDEATGVGRIAASRCVRISYDGGDS